MSKLLEAKLEFKDWLNPVLVRNLRQVLRSNVFALTLCINQYLIAIIFTIFYTFYNGHHFHGQDFNIGYVIKVMIYIFPVYGSRMLEDEVRGRTLETLLLTNNAPRVIVYGNWMTLVFQTTILTFSYLPYTVLSYYSRTESFISLLDIYYAIAVTSGLAALSQVSSLQRVIRRTLKDFLLTITIFPTCVAIGLVCFFLSAHFTYLSVAIFLTVTISSIVVTLAMLRFAIYYIERLPAEQRKTSI